MNKKWRNEKYRTDDWQSPIATYLVRMYAIKVNCTVSSVIVSLWMWEWKKKQHNWRMSERCSTISSVSSIECPRFKCGSNHTYIRLKSHVICYSDSVRNWTWTKSVVIERWSATTNGNNPFRFFFWILNHHLNIILTFYFYQFIVRNISSFKKI